MKLERMHRSGRSALLLSLLWLSGCRKGERPVFELLDADRTGVRFANNIAANDTMNVQTDVYIYNGAGVAVGDIDNDGKPDIYFAGNMVTSRLYLNKGDMRFDDITQSAGVGTKSWATGVTMVDINNDGYLDIYVSVSGPEWSTPEQRRNLLFINNRNRTFTEAAAQYGLDDTGFSTHAAFLDYDGDGCLDMFLLNNAPGDFSRGQGALPSGKQSDTPDSYNKLYRNDCHGHFTDVSEQAGILRQAGYGLGVAIADLNGDGRPDIYVSNDVVTNDVIYINNGNGTFTNKRDALVKHTSEAGMGVDVADFNNDGWPDVAQVDMLPRDLARQKKTLGFSTFTSRQASRARGFRDDYSANALQLSNGLSKDGDPVFSEIGRLAGVSHTDWSWSPLLADFDDDGLKDLFIGNGYPKAVNDLDYMTTTSAARHPGPGMSKIPAGLQNLKNLPTYAEPNYFFRNRGDLTFADESKTWVDQPPSFSYGAAYADLDNDGKLDLVVNNIDAPAFIYHNVRPADETHHSLTVSLAGQSPNVRGLGTTLILTAGGKKQYMYQSPYRGFMSTVDDRIHFGLGAATHLDTLEVIWPDGRSQRITGVSADKPLVLKQSDAIAGPHSPLVPRPAESERLFETADSSRSINYAQLIANTQDYSIQPLLPYTISRHGAPLAVADVNGDGLDDVFIGGGSGVAGQLFLQQKDGRFIASTQGQPWEADKAYEDCGALFFDANGDGLPDLYVASGGYQLTPLSPLQQDRLYVNRGGGRFERDSLALPKMLTSTAAVRAGDFDHDGKLDLFVGGRLMPGKYPFPTRSYILHNDGNGHFKDVTELVAAQLVHPGGMVTDAAWVDFDGDGKLDLVTVGEWMAIEFYRNDGTHLQNVTASTHLPPMRGWWSSLAVGDFDHDGKPDLVAGNLGLNYSYQTSKDSVFGVYAANFSGPQTTDVILTQTVNGTAYSISGMVPLGREIYQLAIKYPTYGSFASATAEQLFGKPALQQAVHYEADTFASVVLHNEGGGVFSASPLPTLAQISPIKSIVVTDVDGDGKLDLLIAGNMYDAEPNTPRADAGNGLLLRGDGHGHFTPVSPRSSGFMAPRDVSGLAVVETPNGPTTVVVSNTGDTLQTFVIRRHR